MGWDRCGTEQGYQRVVRLANMRYTRRKRSSRRSSASSSNPAGWTSKPTGWLHNSPAPTWSNLSMQLKPRWQSPYTAGTHTGGIRAADTAITMRGR